MKTLLLTALTFTGLTLCAPEAGARDHRHYDSDHRSSSCESRSSDYGYYRSDYAPRVSYSHSYYSEPRYYRPAPRYYYSERCEPERRRSHFRPPLISFLFGF